ncbi:MAG: 50S ribosomal protein L30 [Saprospiraceae bacterium]|nr:50S ribosomal protein L30 [Saprospiraceae bacterium]
MSKVRITQVRSVIDQPKRQKATLEALGLKRISQSREHELTPQIRGMIRKIEHLVRIEEV